MTSTPEEIISAAKSQPIVNIDTMVNVDMVERTAYYYITPEHKYVLTSKRAEVEYAKKHVKFIDYSEVTSDRARAFQHVLQAVKTVSGYIYSVHVSMSMGGSLIPKYDLALRLCSFVYADMRARYAEILADGKARYYAKRDRLSLLIGKVFDVFSACDGMLIDMLEIALEKIPSDAVKRSDIAKGAIRARRAIDKFMHAETKNVKSGMSSDSARYDDNTIDTALCERAYIEWTENEHVNMEYDKNTGAARIDTAALFDDCTERQLQVFSTYAALGSIEKTCTALGIKSKGAVHDSITKTRARFFRNIDTQTKFSLQEHYRLIVPERVYDTARIENYRGMYVINKDKDGKQYINIPRYRLLWADMECPHSYGFVVPHRMVKGGSAWYDNTDDICRYNTGYIGHTMNRYRAALWAAWTE